MTNSNPAALLAATIWVSGPVLFKIVSELHTSCRTALVVSCAVLALSWLYVLRAPSRPAKWRADLISFARGAVIFGAAPALVVAGLARIDAVSVALIGALFIFAVPVSAWLLRRTSLDGGFPLTFVLASAGIYAMLYGRIRWGAATIPGDLLLGSGTLLMVLGSMQAPPRATREPFPSRRAAIEISGAALLLMALATGSELNWLGWTPANELPLPAMLAVALSAYWSHRYWTAHEFDWQNWPILLPAALFPIGLVLGRIFFAETLDTGEMIGTGLIALFISATHWLRRWLSS